MKSYLSLIPISAKQHKHQNRMTIMCIVIAVFLVTAVFSMTEMAARQEISRLVEKHGAGEVLGLLSSTAFQSLLPIAAILFIFVLLAGILMISGSMNSNVARRTKMFGMMRCIGMSKRQIIRYVRLEALNWCKTAIPLGLLFGTVSTWILCAILKFVVGGEWSDIPQMRLSVIGICSGIIVGVLTVLIAASKPARRAAKVSPVSALSGNSSELYSAHAITVNNISIENALGKRHATQSKKNLFLIIGSFALSIILFLSFSVIIDLVNCLLPQSAASADIEFVAPDASLIDSDILTSVKHSAGVKRAFGRRAIFDVPLTTGDVSSIGDGSAIAIGDGSQIQLADIISFEDYDLDALKKDAVLCKGSDLNAVKENDAALIISDSRLDNSSPITINGISLNIVGKLRYDIFSSDGTCNGKTTLIVSDKTFKKLTGITDYTMVLIQLDSDVTIENIAAIRSLAGSNRVNDYHEDNTRGTYVAFIVCSYSFLIIIALVTILNIINSISMSTSTRMKQYGAMRAVGMSKRQAAKMIIAEAMTYAVLGCLTGIVLGTGIHKWLYSALVTSHYPYAQWYFPIAELAITLVFFAISVALGVRDPIKRINNMSITETIKCE